MICKDIEEHFFGRKEALALLKRRVVDLKEGYRQNMALMGGPYVGKTTLLKHFIAHLEQPDVVPIYLDLENKDFDYVFSKFAASLLYGFSRLSNLPELHKIDLLLESTKKHIPHTCQVIRRVYDEYQKGKLTAAFLGLMTLPEVFTNETGKFCVLIFDEFQSMENWEIVNPFEELSKKIMTQRRCFYILSSSSPALAKKILSEKLSLLFGSFETVILEPFDMATGKGFIEERLKGIRLGTTLRDFLIDFTGGHPLYLNLITKEMMYLCAAHQQKEVFLPIVSQSLENTLFDRWGVLSRHFELMVHDISQNKAQRMINHLLISFANGNNQLTQIMDDTGINKTQLMQKINRLIELDFVVKNGAFYQLKDKLFKYWLKYVYQKRLKDIELSFDHPRQGFRDELQACVEAFHLNARKDFASRLVDLFNRFDNRQLDLNGRRYKLPVFKQLTPCKIETETGEFVEFIKGVAEEGDWLIAYNNKHLGEHEMNLILEQSKKFKSKPERKLIISLSAMEDNVRLKALQEKCWIWNEGELRALSSLFEQPIVLP